MGKVSQYSELSWLMAKNPEMVDILDIEYAHNRMYFPYLNELAGFLRRSGVANLQNKKADARDLEKFESIVSELEIARSGNSEQESRNAP